MLLTGQKDGDMRLNARVARLLLIFGAFLGGLLLCFTVILLVIGPRMGPTGWQAAVGATFPTDG